MDPIADFLTRIRNAINAHPKLPSIEVKSSYVKKCITEILCAQGYIQSYEFHGEKNYQGTINIVLKYHPKTKEPAIVRITRISKPGKRIYSSKDEIKPVFNGLGISIVSTSQGIMTDKEAKKRGIGGEILCNVY